MKNTKCSIIKRISKYFNQLLLDEGKRTTFQFVCVYIALGIIALIMTVMNIFTGKGALILITGVFAILCFVNFIFARSGKPGLLKASKILFAVEIIVLFLAFVISGNPDGFSILWSLLLPTLGLLLFGIKIGSLLSGIFWIIIALLFWTPLGNLIILYDYNPTFRMRFPVLFIAFLGVGLIFEIIRSKTFENYKNLYTHDALTGALNRVGFQDYINEKLAGGNHSVISFAIFDLDLFKSVNDTYGHFVGDEVLKNSAQKLAELTQLPVCRWGGEEYAVVDFDNTLNSETCDRIVKGFAESGMETSAGNIAQTISMGCAASDLVKGLSVGKLGSEADKRLYEAKESGRNKAVYSVITDYDLIKD